jgi:hypothetical protein
MDDETPGQIVLNYCLREHAADVFHWSRMPLINTHQAIFLSYGIEPPQGTGHFFPQYAERFLEHADRYRICVLLQGALDARLIRFQNPTQIKAEDFVKWAKEHDIPIREEFFYRAKVNAAQEKLEESVSERQMRPETIRKHMMRLGAQARWGKERREKKTYTKPTKLAGDPDLLQLLTLTSNMLGLSDPEEIDPGWFGDLYPGDDKPGPKHRRKTEILST